MSRFWLDTEFIERGPQYPIELISIGMVDENGREFYAISSEFDPDHASEWVKENVIAKLEPSVERIPLSTMAYALIAYIWPNYLDSKPKPEFWAYYADYDWVCFAQIFGTMMDLPNSFPKYCLDIKQLCVERGNPKLPEQADSEHNALADARWNKQAWEFLVERRSGADMIAAERQRQIDEEEWTAEHDDAHRKREMAQAALCYVRANDRPAWRNEAGPPPDWPWESEWWKPETDIQNLVKAGALIAAEIDRLQRIKK